MELEVLFAKRLAQRAGICAIYAVKGDQHFDTPFNSAAAGWPGSVVWHDVSEWCCVAALSDGVVMRYLQLHGSTTKPLFEPQACQGRIARFGDGGCGVRGQ